jgi:hypothetical protein
MKSILILLAFVAGIPALGQLKVTPKCQEFSVDLLEGKINGVHPDFTNGQIKSGLPCFTSEDPATSTCGNVIVYGDRDVKFYTDRDYVQIGPAFKGKLSLPLMGARRGSFFKWLGNPRLKDTGWDAYETQYGCLVLYYDKANKVNKIRFSTVPISAIQVCTDSINK